MRRFDACWAIQHSAGHVACIVMRIELQKSPKLSKTPGEGRDLANWGPANRSRVNVRDPMELKYWCKQLALSPEQLKRAAVLAGVMLTDIKTYLARRSLS